MARRDWKKISIAEDRTTWHNEKLNQDVVVGDMRKGAFPTPGFPYSVLIAEVENDGGYNQLNSRWFRTKSKALKAARNYMRTY